MLIFFVRVSFIVFIYNVFNYLLVFIYNFNDEYYIVNYFILKLLKYI